MSVLDSLLDGVSHFIGVVKIDRIRNAHSPVVKCCFFRWTWFWSPHTVFLQFLYLWKVLIKNPDDAKLAPLGKLSNMQITAAITERLWCIHLGFHGHWFWLDYCREDPAICICIIMQIRSAITEIVSVCPNSFITQGKSTIVVSIYSIIKSISPSASAQSSLSSSEALSFFIYLVWISTVWSSTTCTKESAW